MAGAAAFEIGIFALKRFMTAITGSLHIRRVIGHIYAQRFPGRGRCNRMTFRTRAGGITVAGKPCMVAVAAGYVLVGGMIENNIHPFGVAGIKLNGMKTGHQVGALFGSGSGCCENQGQSAKCKAEIAH